MKWLAGGVLYSIGYLIAGWYLHGNAHALLWLRIIALLIPPLTGILVIARRRQEWTGCHWLFWATVALGLSMMAIGLVGSVQVLEVRETSRRVVYRLRMFGIPLSSIGSSCAAASWRQRPMMASIAVDMAGIAVMTGYLSCTSSWAGRSPLMAQTTSMPLLLLHEFQQFLACAAFTIAAIAARGLT
jgi:hypothetical protein